MMWLSIIRHQTCDPNNYIYIFILSNAIVYGVQYILALCICGTLGKSIGTLGKGTLCTYPSFRVPTHHFRVLGFIARGSSKGEFVSCKKYCLTAVWCCCKPSDQPRDAARQRQGAAGRQNAQRLRRAAWWRQGAAGRRPARRRQRAGRMTRQSTDGGGGQAGTTGRWWGYVGGALVATTAWPWWVGIPADAVIWNITILFT